MSDKEYVIHLSPELEDRFRYYHRLARGQIVRFRIQYEAFIEGEWKAIVRYDTAHGWPHRDILHPDGTQDKQDFLGHSAAEALTIGERDIKANWKYYRSVYEQEMKR